MEGNGLHQIGHYGTVLVSHGVTHRISSLTPLSLLITWENIVAFVMIYIYIYIKTLTLFFASWLSYSFLSMAWDIWDIHK